MWAQNSQMALFNQNKNMKQNKINDNACFNKKKHKTVKNNKHFNGENLCLFKKINEEYQGVV